MTQQCSGSSAAAAEAAGEELAHTRRRFVLPCSSAAAARLRADFPVDSLAEGRMDLKCRCIVNALMVSNGIRRGSRIDLLHEQAERMLYADGWSARRGLRPDERTVACRIRDLLEDVDGAGTPRCGPRARRAEAGEPQRWAEAGLGLEQWRGGLSEALSAASAELAAAAAEDGTEAAAPLLFVLDAAGAPAWATLQALCRPDGIPHAGAVVCLGDDCGLLPEHWGALEAAGAQRISLGAVPLLASQCIAILHNHLDQLGTRLLSAAPARNPGLFGAARRSAPGRSPDSP
eukprot:TRINITY_DN66259_c0_g1_i1.p1 TRINITY_DN66259_c0_g1~~TRINITY_DN66259_c0_g1_i1.p1  ORF type:complete len:331 (+),score=80.37 TRINITY_DN66259_c0_g1_i1:128-994(+)